MRIVFRFRPIPFTATVLLIALGVSLGQWQEKRAAQKSAAEHLLNMRKSAPPVNLPDMPVAAEQIEYRRVLLKGEFIADWPVYLDNRPYRGMAGFYLLMPFKPTGSQTHVLVARGWVRRDIADRHKLPPVFTPRGELQLEGIAVKSVGTLLSLGKEEEPVARGVILQNLTTGAFAVQFRQALQPFFVEQITDSHDGLVRDWPSPSSGIERHQGYMVTWYGLALMAAVYYLSTGLKRQDEATG